MWIFQGCIAPEIQHRYIPQMAIFKRSHLWKQTKTLGIHVSFPGCSLIYSHLHASHSSNNLSSGQQTSCHSETLFRILILETTIWRPSIKQGTLYYQPKQCTKGNSLKITWINIHLYCLGSKKMREFPSTIPSSKGPSIHPSYLDLRVFRTPTYRSSLTIVYLKRWLDPTHFRMWLGLKINGKRNGEISPVL